VLKGHRTHQECLFLGANPQGHSVVIFYGCSGHKKCTY
jgi:hypothetical protein